MKIHKKLLALFISILLLMQLAPLSAFAVVDTDSQVSLTIYYHDNGQALTGAEFDIYTVALYDKNGKLALTEQFSGYSVDINPTDGEFKALASTLEGYTLRDNITPTDSGTVASNGALTFPNNSVTLKAGLYLVLGHRHRQNGTVYEAVPFAVMLPYTSDGGVLCYTLEVVAKYESRNNMLGNNNIRPVSRKVLKAWRDNGNQQRRPDKITVQLLRDGKLYQTVELSQENNWQYEWTELNGQSSWNITELTPEGYQVSITREGSTFVVTNTLQPQAESGSDSSSDSSGNSDVSGGNQENQGQEKPATDSRLPQTGVLWWPVPLLCVGGLLFIILGILTKKKEHND